MSATPCCRRPTRRWARPARSSGCATNLFSGWFNAILTVLSVVVVLAAALGDRALVRQFGLARLVAGRNAARILQRRDSGACFAVITERWQQLLYGFYPQQLYWRADLTLLLLFVALFPVLFDEVSAGPRAMLSPVVLFVLSGLMVWGTYWSVIDAAAPTRRDLRPAVLFAVFAASLRSSAST